MWQLIRATLTASALSLFALSSHATAINLSDFEVTGSVDFFDNGFTAALTENRSENVFHQIENNPFEGAEQLILPEVGSVLSFDYVLEGLAGFGDIFPVPTLFEFQLFGEDTTMALEGFDFNVAADNDFGSVSFDLSELAGQTIGARFILLVSPFSGSDDVATLTVSNVQVTSSQSVAVFEPSTLGMFALPLLILFTRRKLR